MNHSSSGATVGLTANPELRAFIELLHEHNLESVVELPVIAVVGDTSSGKSSLLSALSGFEFPSHSDICTRCPTRLHLERRARPSYGVSIEWKQTKKGQQFSKDCSTLEELNDLMIQAQNLVRKSSTTAISSDVVHVKICEPDVVDLSSWLSSSYSSSSLTYYTGEMYCSSVQFVGGVHNISSSLCSSLAVGLRTQVTSPRLRHR